MTTRDTTSDSLWEIQGLSRFSGDPFDAARRAHEQQLSLCSTLDTIAMSLSTRVNRQKCILVARSIWPLVRSGHSFEEKILFPYVTQFLPENRKLENTFERLTHEHAEDEAYAEDVSEMLFKIAAGGRIADDEVAQYMLKSFATGLRRHMAFEREFILTPAEQRG